MKKYVVTGTNSEVRMGGIVEVRFPFDELGIGIIKYPVTEETIPFLLEKGIIEEISEPSEIDIDDVVKHLASRIGWNIENLDKYLDNLYKIYPAAVFSIILREFAIIMDEKYPDHINKSREIWSISTLNGEIVRVKNLNKIKNFKNFAAFRTLEDALKAKKIMKRALEDLFNRNGK